MASPIIGLPEISENQASKYITHNRANQQIEALLIRVLSRTVSDEKSLSPSNGDSYIVAQASFSIVGVDTSNEIVRISGDKTTRIDDGDNIDIRGSTGNDGSYTVNGAPSYDSTNDETDITVNEDLTDSTADGTVDHASGAFNGRLDEIAYQEGGAWSFFVPVEGVRLWVNDEDAPVVNDGSKWLIFSAGVDIESNGSLVESNASALNAGDGLTGSSNGDGTASFAVDSTVIRDADKTGVDANVVSGTAGTGGNLAEWNADGDAIGAGFSLGGALRGYIDGCETANNSTDPDHDIDFQPGVCAMRDGSGNAKLFDLTSTIVKQIDANWAAGSGVGGFPSGLTLSASTEYNLFLIGQDDGTVDAGFDSADDASNLLADATNYSWFRRVLSVLTEGNSNIEGYQEIDGRVLLQNFIKDVDDSNFASGDTVSYVTSVPKNQIGLFICDVETSSADKAEIVVSDTRGVRQINVVFGDASSSNKDLRNSGQSSVDLNSEINLTAFAFGNGTVDQVFLRTTGWIDAKDDK